MYLLSASVFRSCQVCSPLFLHLKNTADNLFLVGAYMFLSTSLDSRLVPIINVLVLKVLIIFFFCIYR
jgi:hypothetical protein